MGRPAAAVDAALRELRGEADAEDLAAVNRSVPTLKDAVARLTDSLTSPKSPSADRR